jgi:indole-3-glycerol phosphate synthase/phosphoribosylanthranilate isomerase
MAAQSGATHAGLILAPLSLRKVNGQAEGLAGEARTQGLKPVGVFQDEDPGIVARRAHGLGLAAVQLHGRETHLERLRDLLPAGCEIWAACGVAETVEPERDGADRIVYDTSLAGRSGGTGRAFDWKLLANRPFLANAFIAGGIGPGNARSAQQTGAFGIDVGSAVEAAPGRKDLTKVQSLFKSLRPASRGSVQCG